MEALIASYGDLLSDSDSKSPAPPPSLPPKLNSPQEPTSTLSPPPLSLLNSPNSFGNLRFPSIFYFLAFCCDGFFRVTHQVFDETFSDWRQRWRFAMNFSAWLAVGALLSSLPWAWAFSLKSHSSSPVRLAAMTERPWLLCLPFGYETLSQSLNSYLLHLLPLLLLWLLSLLPNQGTLTVSTYLN
ncbi:unnamed protein product [Malus baccata var. baccata]